ncbi:MAG: Ldh family oxidoreductase [Chloroflexi bacterium]|nr:Ldh family oxidoreductase [Chloroflexota bacterium]MBA3586004.1 Ldh family oxidoreductase [Chloroflexota bacterium]
MADTGQRSLAGEGRVVSVSALRAFCKEAFLRTGVAPADSETGADALATTDAWGVFTHGSKLLQGNLLRLKGGGLRAQARPTIAAEGGAWAIVDGGAGLGMVTSAYAMQVAIAKARAQGIGYVGVRNGSHFGAAGYYAWLAAREGLIGLSMANDIPSVAAPGSRGAITGSNPIAYAVPVDGRRPMLLDMSIATVAGGKVYAARERGEPIPPGWLIDVDGRPTTDPGVYPAHGALTPAAGHKGYGLGLLVETLAGILSGAEHTWRIRSWMTDGPTGPTLHGGAFLAIDCAALSEEGQFGGRMAELVEEIHAAPRADGVERIYVPGEMEWDRYEQAMTDGIVLPSDVLASVATAASIVGLDVHRDLLDFS